ADGAQPAKAVLPAVRSGRYGRGARADHRSVRQLARPRDGQRGVGAVAARRRRSRAARRLSDVRARDRAARADHGRPGLLGLRPAGCPHGRAGVVRRAHQADVRADGARLSGGAHAGRLDDDGGRDQHADLQPGRDLRGIPPAVTPSEQRGQARTARRRAALPLGDLRGLPREAEEHARRRRLAARSLDTALRQQHERLEPAQRRSVARGDLRSRPWPHQRGPAPGLRAGHAACQSDPDGARACGRAVGIDRRQHRRADGGLMRVARPRLRTGAAALAALAVLAAGGLAAEPTLPEAVEANNRELALDILATGADVDERSADGTTALHWAVHHGDLDLVKALLERGADATVRNDYGATPISTAAVEGDFAMIET